MSELMKAKLIELFAKLGVEMAGTFGDRIRWSASDLATDLAPLMVCSKCQVASADPASCFCQACGADARRFKRMAERMAAMIVWPSENEMNRAAGNCVCSECGLDYSQHPHKDGLVLTCDSRLWKL